MLFLIFAVICFLQLSFTNSGDPCPSKDALGSCSCSRKSVKISQFSPEFLFGWSKKSNDVTSHFTTITCDKVKNFRSLKQYVYNSCAGRYIDQLVIIKAPPQKPGTVAWLPTGWLEDSNVGHIEIRDTVLAGNFISEGEPFLDAADYLIWLSFISCFLSGILTYDTAGTVNTKGLENLTNLQVLELSDNYLIGIDAKAFEKLTTLNTLILSRNSLQDIPKDTFSKLEGLTYLDLSHNLIKTIDAAALAADPKALVYFDISFNDIKTISDAFFDKMVALKTVNASTNHLTSLPQAVWEKPWTIVAAVNVSGNNFKCDCNINWLPVVLRKAPVNQNVFGECLYFFSVRPMRTTNYPLATLTERQLNCP